MPIRTLSVTQDMDGSKEEVAPLIQQLLQDKAVLLQECFGIQVGAEGHLAALPQLIEGHCPDLDRLPHFVLQLARDVDWEDEKQCFKGLAQVKCPPRCCLRRPLLRLLTNINFYLLVLFS